jgi:endonuclease/exonuclease/phosphatase family metal-dependent hydrolase
MPRILRKVTKGILVAATIVNTVVFLVACSSAFLDPIGFLYISLLAIGMIFWIVGLIGFFVFWMFLRSKWAILPLLALIIGWPQINALFAFHPLSSYHVEKEPGTVRVLQYNVSRFDESAKYGNPGGAVRTTHREDFFKFIRDQQVDICCLEEFFESNDPKTYESNKKVLIESLGLKYYHFAADHYYVDSTYELGVAIFSRYPIVGRGRVRYDGPEVFMGKESLIYADIDVNGSIVRVYATHLQSMLFHRSDYAAIKELPFATENAVNDAKGLFWKFRTAYSLRTDQVNIIKDELAKSPYPRIVCGDFNDVPTSWSHFTLAKNLQDVFTKKGFGLGRTFSLISPTLRIDYILAEKSIPVVQTKTFKLNYSDHYPVVADLKIPAKEK